jgi:hypothetical protein
VCEVLDVVITEVAANARIELAGMAIATVDIMINRIMLDVFSLVFLGVFFLSPHSST